MTNDLKICIPDGAGIDEWYIFVDSANGDFKPMGSVRGLMGALKWVERDRAFGQENPTYRRDMYYLEAM